MFDLRKDSDIKDLRFCVFDFLHKYGFNDGDGILEEEVEIVEHLCHKLANAIGIVDNRWEPIVFASGPHNPYHIKFKDLQTGEIEDYYSMGERESRKLWKRIEEIMEGG